MIQRGRFAPSPTGRLHFGSLVAALGSWLRARSRNAEWLVRIEDLDSVREVAGASVDILETLAALGLHGDGAIVLQSERTARYASAFEQLVAAGHVYPCQCSRADLTAFHGIHPEQCVRSLGADRNRPAWRVRVDALPRQFEDAVFGPVIQSLRESVGDFVLRRNDGVYAYQLAVVVDDADQGITEVVRGADLLDSTPRQIFLQQLLGLPTPHYLHLPLALDEDGRKLSKHESARPVERDDPIPALREALAFLGQRIPNETAPDRFLRSAAGQFDIARIPIRTPPHVAMRKD
ncbi:tRNA glutamyl-Q(34) synthetase GluQRS [Dokdonella sp.]|uniref:tRNA glutamyl-Q(34) synthetase GluQRS n=1 Tax=Dokdonella sp. TaxID=2291710 RepID=UPI002C84EEE9|nr:tRNA glutamyl-Q(34) synthetase GluQRS [Dokdonella sp.]HOX71951.1 tRNA glutamyl-Q(34) synthetase GluQRS [Dokdonella sp.]HPN79979.1 tRNA glutamyl-Q(34) synthetase GluQRS [Dokdonella sp.]